MYGRRIKELRLEAHLTQKQLADALQVDFRTVSFWENERFEPNIEQITKLCKYFSISADYLLGITNYDL